MAGSGRRRPGGSGCPRRGDRRRTLTRHRLTLAAVLLDALRDVMAQNGVRISTSQAIKLALRTAPLDAAALRQALDAIRSEDGRKW